MVWGGVFGNKTGAAHHNPPPPPPHAHTHTHTHTHMHTWSYDSGNLELDVAGVSFCRLQQIDCSRGGAVSFFPLHGILHSLIAFQELCCLNRLTGTHTRAHHLHGHALSTDSQSVRYTTQTHTHTHTYTRSHTRTHTQPGWLCSNSRDELPSRRTGCVTEPTGVHAIFAGGAE